MAKLLLSGAILTSIVWSGVWLRGCGQHISTTFHVSANSSSTRTVRSYPKIFALTPLKRGTQLSSNLRLLQKPRHLHGSLVFINNENTPERARGNAVLQRFDFGKSTFRVLEFKLPDYDPQTTSQMFPMSLGGTRDKIFIRAARTGSDAGEFDLYKVDTQTRKGHLVTLSIFDNYLAVSPNGNSCVYQIVSGWTRDWPYWVCNTNGRKNQLNKNQLKKLQSIDRFSWTSRNTLIYAAFRTAQNTKVNYGFPNIYEDDLNGKTRELELVKGATFPLLSPNRRYLAAVVPSWNRKTPPQKGEEEDMQYGNTLFGDDHIALAVFDIQKKQKYVVKKVDSKNPEIFWTKTSQLVFVEHFNIGEPKTSLGRVWLYDAQRKRTQLLYSAKGLFTPVRVANDRYLLCNEVTEGAQVKHIFTLDLQLRRRVNIFEVPALQSPIFDWIDS